MLQDRYGLALSTSSEAAAYRDGIDLMLSAWPGAAEAFDAAIAADSDFALARAARALALDLCGRLRPHATVGDVRGRGRRQDSAIFMKQLQRALSSAYQKRVG
jgi:hypothetical protein